MRLHYRTRASSICGEIRFIGFRVGDRGDLEALGPEMDFTSWLVAVFTPPSGQVELTCKFPAGIKARVWYTFVVSRLQQGSQEGPSTTCFSIFGIVGNR